MTSYHYTNQHPGVPPKFAERLLCLFVHEDDRDMILGDFEEACAMVSGEKGARQTRKWYWMEVLKALPSLGLLTIVKHAKEQVMNAPSLIHQNKKMAVIGMILIIPAFLLCLNSVLGITSISDALGSQTVVFHPAVILGGLSVAFILNLLAVGRISYENGSLVGGLLIEGRGLNLSLIAGIGLILILAGI
tara:strand:+ start:29 stop:598 length:570 start_codon:yes stop_codon:yes gene_type:complete